MNPDDKRKLDELYAWMKARKVQQLSKPVDDASKNVLGAAFRRGNGSHDLTDTITIGAGGGSASVPAAYSGTVIFLADGITFEIPYL